MNLLHQRREIFRSIDMLVPPLQRPPRNRLESDAQHRAAALGCEFEHAIILRELGGNASLPLDAAAPQGPHELLRTLGGAEKIRVIHRDGTRAAILHLVDNFVDWAVTELEPVHQRFGAECATLMAAA